MLSHPSASSSRARTSGPASIGRWRARQGEHEVDLGPGDYVAWDGTIPHDVELVGDEDGKLLVVARRADHVV